eukprot:CAMPEP_0113399864 /NCGR_PEP_ID=MMETSP0013_2-20120614/15785_1 /TAXON_ID=2843 ORGANISM="Skeletonema costatum, Strain 1716" /NCGR_SAMPLE_ID=MMETSP0013_2 /ASSEMBLY_ACC=CAM_ASM_000158 /LENGTH=81 /DNA_ID=CAMNT_0000284831 /DNA_START=24 /DNA_END=269 /DNA_ORIENTATION=+ /assembly_acc=CAM_ASM_000158
MSHPYSNDDCAASAFFKGITVDSEYIFVRGMPMEGADAAAHDYDDNDEIARIDERYRDALEQSDSGKNQPLSPPARDHIIT